METVKKYNKSPQGRLVSAKTRHNRQTMNKKVCCSLTLDQWNKIIVMQKGYCAMCGKKFSSKRKPTKDHIIPLTKGGGLTFENVQALCKSCNCKKNDKIDNGKITTWISDLSDFKPDGINRRSESQKRHWATPGSREKHSVYQKKRFENPEERKKLSIARRKLMESPIARKNLSDAKKKSHIDKQWYGSVKYSGDRRAKAKVSSIVIQNDMGVVA